MASQNVPFSEAEDFIALGSMFEVLEGPNIQDAPDNLTMLPKANGTPIQWDCTRRIKTGTMKVAMIDDAGVLPATGEPWAISGASAAPYQVVITAVNVEGQSESNHTVYSITFIYAEVPSTTTTTYADMTTAA